MGFGEILREFGVKVNLGFDGKQVDLAQTKIQKFAVELRSFAVEAAGVTAGLLAVQNSFTSNARSLQNQANLLGINTDELQEYEYAAKVMGDVNRDELVGSLQQLGNTMDQARAGSAEARQSIEQLGIFSGKAGLIIDRLSDPTYKVTDAFKDMSEGIQQISKNSPLAASRIVQQTLGSANLFNVLREGPEAIDKYMAKAKLNYEQNQKMIDQGAKLDKQISEIWLTFKKFGRDIGFAVSGPLMGLVNQFVKWSAENKEFISSGIVEFATDFVEVMKDLFSIFKEAIPAIKEFVENNGGMKKTIKELVDAFIIFKGLAIASTFISMAGSIFTLLTPLKTLGASLWGVTKAFKAFTLIEGIADILPAIELFGSGAVVALTPLLPILLALGAAGVALHEIMAAMNGEEGWTEKALNFVTGIGSGGGKGSNPEMIGAAAPTIFGNPRAQSNTGGYGVAPGQSGPISISNTNHVTVPKGTSPERASDIVSKATDDSIDTMLRSALIDSSRIRDY